MSVLGVTGCGQLVTLAGPARPRVREELRELGVIRGGALLVRDGVIERAGPRAAVEPHFGPDAAVIDAGGALVMPGFVDAHTHAVFAGDRADEFEQRLAGATYESIAAAGGGIRATVRRTRAADEETLLAAARRRLTWMRRGGTTCVEIKSGYGLSVADELKMLRVIARLGDRVVPTFLGAHEVPDEYRGRKEEYVALVIHEMLPAAAPLAAYCDVFCEPHVFTVEDARRILAAARNHGLGLRGHVDQLTASGGAELMAELSAATADHLEHTGPAGIAALARAAVQPVLLPGAVHGLGLKRYPDARAMVAAGLAIVVATDFNPGSSPTPSLPLVLSLACREMRLTPAEAITAATVNAAYSLGRGAQLGSLEPGKLADFVIHDAEDFREVPYWFGVETARQVFIGGEPV
jgi:imidazolonepropionase